MSKTNSRPNKKIGILSDSHSKIEYTKLVVEQIKSLGCEYIIHAGDICKYENLEILKNSGLKTVMVYGNNDFNLVSFGEEFNIKQEPYYFKIDDIKFKLMHLPFYLSPDSDVIIYGHTHIYEAKKMGSTLFLNSGEVCARQKPLIEFLTLEIGKKFIVERFYKEVNSLGFTKEILEFER